MNKAQAIAALAALAQDTRLDIFRCLIRQGSQGLAAGQIAEQIGVPQSTLSFHLKTLRQAGLIGCRRESRSLIYHTDFATMNELLGYLTEQCCQDAPDRCGLTLWPDTANSDSKT